MSETLHRRQVLFGTAALFATSLSGMPAAFAQTVGSGRFTRQDYSINGSWKIVKDGNSHYVELSSDFSTRNGPDIKLFLSPTSVNALNGSNATSGSVRISRVKAKGAQRFKLPSGTNPSRFKSVVIHCEKFSKLWGAGAL